MNLALRNKIKKVIREPTPVVRRQPASQPVQLNPLFIPGDHRYVLIANPNYSTRRLDPNFQPGWGDLPAAAVDIKTTKEGLLAIGVPLT